MNAVSAVFCNGSREHYNISFQFQEPHFFLRTFSYRVNESTHVEKITVQEMLDELPELVIQDVYLEIERNEHNKMLNRANKF